VKNNVTMHCRKSMHSKTGWRVEKLEESHIDHLKYHRVCHKSSHFPEKCDGIAVISKFWGELSLQHRSGNDVQ
jgi:hypothetical protein